jgi:hypothetical protein
MKKINSIPLLNEHHTHVSFYMAMRKCLDVRKITSCEEAFSLIKELGEDVNIVLGWTFGDSADIRSRIEKELPAVLICDGGLHNYIMNQKAKDKLIDRYPEIVNNIENSEWIEHHIYLILRFIAQNKTIVDADVHEFFDHMLMEHQIYRMEDLLLPDTDFIDMYERTGYSNRLKYWMDIESYKKLSDKYTPKISGIKLFLDGAIGPETAALNGYVNSKSDGGMLFKSDEELTSDLKYVEKQGKSAAVHALGEIAIEQLISVVEREKIKLPCLRIEHAQYISLDAARRCKKLGIVLSMQINFSAETTLFKGVLTKECLERNNQFRMLIDKAGYVPGEDLIFGSDGMPHGAVTALNNAFLPVLDTQKLTFDEFVKGYCMDTNEHGEISFEIKDNAVVKVKTVKY